MHKSGLTFCGYMLLYLKALENLAPFQFGGITMNGIDKREIYRAVADNDREWLADAFNHLGLKSKDSRTMVTNADAAFMKVLFASASISAQNDDLEAETIKLLIERTVPEIDLFDFIYTIVFARKINVSDDVDYGQLPKNVKQALLSNTYSDEIGDAIMQMSDYEIGMLCSFIYRKITRIDIDFTYPIVSCIYDKGLVPDAQLVTTMGFSIKKACSGGMMPGLGGLLALGALGAMLDD